MIAAGQGLDRAIEKGGTDVGHAALKTVPGDVAGVHGCIDVRANVLTIYVEPCITRLTLDAPLIPADVLAAAATGVLGCAGSWVSFRVERGSQKECTQVQQDRFVRCAYFTEFGRQQK